VESALNAGMKSVVLTTMHEAHEFSQYPNILLFTADYTHPLLAQILDEN
jgi:beta-phosphoglucomutase-like phosphatase (HAD superfamily)